MLFSFQGGSPVMYTPAPRGVCENCCIIQESKDIKFFLFSRDNPKTGRQLYMSDDKRLRHINKTRPLIFYLHGFSESAPGTPNSSSYEIREGSFSHAAIKSLPGI